MKEIERIRKDINELLSREGFKVYHVEYLKEDGEYFLRVELDDVDTDGCEKASGLLSEMLDEKDYLDDAYILDVCSSGAEKVLYDKQQIEQALNEYVHIDFKKKINNLKFVEGYLESIDEGSLTIAYMDKNIKRKMTIAEEDIKLIRLAVKL
jgi:ribosome maturation factor RimP